MQTTDAAEHTRKLVLVTGLSGSGKSTVAKAFEDLGYYTVDNLPLPLLERLLEDPFALVDGTERIAVVTDVRAPGFARELPRMVAEVDRTRIEPVLLFLEASDETLVRRFSETRRPHPLAADRPVIDGIVEERKVLADVRGIADMILDTSGWNIHEIRREIYRQFARRSGAQTGPSMVVSLISFGFKHGIPYGTDLLFDVRFLPNPHFVPSLREQTGRDPEVVAFLEEQPEYGELIDRLVDLLGYLLPRYRREHRSYVSIAIGCTGGQHRSVALVEEIERRLAAEGWPVRTSHRDAPAPLAAVE